MKSHCDDLIARRKIAGPGLCVFSRRGIPLLLLPKDRTLAQKTIDLYLPQTRLAKAAIRGLRILNGFGLISKCLPPSNIPDAGGHAGFLLCNPNHGSRFLAVERDSTGFRVLKIADEESASSVRREFGILSTFSQRPGIPATTKLPLADGFGFSMPCYQPMRENWHRSSSVPDMLRGWFSGQTESATDNSLIQSVLKGPDDPLRSVLEGKSVQKAVIHGDFAPWNLRRDSDGRCVAIDWEWANPDGFAGFDLVYGLVQEAVLVRKMDRESVSRFVIREISRNAWMAEQISLSGLSLDLILRIVIRYRENKIGTILRKHGVFVCVDGADGVGKSTLLRLAVPNASRSGGFRGFSFFHWKPVRHSMNDGEIPVDSPHDPRGKRPRSPLASFLYLAYHWLGFQIGYWTRIHPRIREGRLVVADRYSFDVFLDPQRFRLSLPDGILKLFVRTIPRPDRTIILHADPDTILRRKPELSKNEIATYQERALWLRRFSETIFRSADGSIDSVLPPFLEDMSTDALP